MGPPPGTRRSGFERAVHRDPSGVYGAIITLAAAVLAALGVPVEGWVEDVLAWVVMVGGPALVSWLIRRKAYAPETVDRIKAAPPDTRGP